MISILFGYSSEYEFHGPLELILGYIDFKDLESKMVYVCKNFYVASVYSYLGRKIERIKIERILYGDEVVDKSFDEYLVRLYKYKCITFDNNLFIRFVLHGLIKIIKILLENEKENIDPSYKNNKAIREASYYGHLNVVKLLMSDSRVDPSDMYNYAIILASRNGHYDIVKLLMSDSRVDPSNNRHEAIIDASKNGHYDIVRLLMSDSRVDPSKLEWSL